LNGACAVDPVRYNDRSGSSKYRGIQYESKISCSPQSWHAQIMHRTEGPKLLNKVSLNTIKARRNIGKCRQGDTITNCRYMSLTCWNAGKAHLDNGSHTVTYKCGVSRVHVNTNSIRQLIKPQAAGTFATHPVSLAPRDNKSETPTLPLKSAAVRDMQQSA
jgi:hypothetical protein